jgi:hypothetical protein
MAASEVRGSLHGLTERHEPNTPHLSLAAGIVIEQDNKTTRQQDNNGDGSRSTRDLRPRLRCRVFVFGDAVAAPRDVAFCQFTLTSAKNTAGQPSAVGRPFRLAPKKYILFRFCSAYTSQTPHLRMRSQSPKKVQTSRTVAI